MQKERNLIGLAIDLSRSQPVVPLIYGKCIMQGGLRRQSNYRRRRQTRAHTPVAFHRNYQFTSATAAADLLRARRRRFCRPPPRQTVSPPRRRPAVGPIVSACRLCAPRDRVNVRIRRVVAVAFSHRLYACIGLYTHGESARKRVPVLFGYSQTTTATARRRHFGCRFFNGLGKRSAGP